jgi:ABC-type Fe3+/spermidine/putrescine transport system ATPase subunit
VQIGGVLCEATLVGDAAAGDPVSLAVRPESIAMNPAAEIIAEPNTIAGIVRGKVFLGESTDFLVESGSTEVRVRVSGQAPSVTFDDSVALTLPADECLVFRAQDGAGHTASRDFVDLDAVERASD